MLIICRSVRESEGPRFPRHEVVSFHFGLYSLRRAIPDVIPIQLGSHLSSRYHQFGRVRTRSKSEGAAPASGKATTVHFSKAPLPNSEADWQQFQAKVQPFLAKNCFECHGEKVPKTTLDSTYSPMPACSRRAVVRSRTFTRNSPTTRCRRRKSLVPSGQLNMWSAGWITTSTPVCPVPPNPGRVTLRRLNRAEYNNTMRDLLGIELQPGQRLSDRYVRLRLRQQRRCPLHRPDADGKIYRRRESRS